MLATIPPRGFLRRGLIFVGIVATATLGVLVWRWSERELRQRGGAQPVSAPTYLGKGACAPCHAEQTEAWSHSDHALAMQKSSDASVLGTFNGAQFTKDGVSSSFLKKEGNYFVRTAGPDGKLQEYELPYTFGYFPLQQYLVPFPNGRLQCLVLAWDSRPKDKGGQRWFHLYLNQKIAPGDPLHWTGPNQTWNYMCADCHSTNLRKNYDLASNSYTTKWSEINVSCEQCHGPASAHVAWAEKRKKGSPVQANDREGLVVNLKPVDGSWWLMKPNDVTMHWKGQPRTRTELETCAPCHSRRRPITSHYQPGQHFLDAYAPTLLEEGIYYADGQILEEDYEYGSFLQSKMYREGVTCSDCHDPHSGKLAPVSLNQACGKCHLLEKFGAAEHLHHKAGSAGALCINCHMPTRTYMVVDVRRDHSFRVPRPDLSVQYGTPNACNQCHKNKSAKWAAAAVVKWFGPARDKNSQFVEALDAGRRGRVDAEKLLVSLIADSSKPAIARATALTLLPAYLTSASLPAVRDGLADSDALVRAAVVRALELLSPQERVLMGASLLIDPIRSVRIEAARLLAGTSPQLLQDAQKVALDRAVSELIASEMATAERPENHLNLSLVYAQMERGNDAERELKTALRLDPNFIPAMVNLADLYRAQNRDADAEQWLEKAIALAPNAAEPIHALGLLKIRKKQYPEALTLLGKAVTLQPGNVRYSYVYAVALNSSGQAAKAITVLEQAHKRRPADRDVLIGLITFERDRGNLPSAISYAEQLAQLDPSDPNRKALLAELRGRSR